MAACACGECLHRKSLLQHLVSRTEGDYNYSFCTSAGAGCMAPSGCFASASMAANSSSRCSRLRFLLVFLASFASFFASFAFLVAPMCAPQRGVVYMALGNAKSGM